MKKIYDIKSFNFITWNWTEDVVMEAVKKEIDYQVDELGVNTIWKIVTKSNIQQNID